MNEVLAILAAATLILLTAIIALNKQQVTPIVYTIHMRIGRVTALVTAGNDIGRNALPQPVVENKILSDEPAVEALLLYLFGIIDNTAFEVKHMLKSMMQHVCAGLFATDAAGAVHNDIFIFLFLQHINRHR
jgi:hypothetical protein